MRFALKPLIGILFILVTSSLKADPLDSVVAGVEAFPHVTSVDVAEREVRDYEVGLGALNKIRGVWRFKDSERISGALTRHTWQVVDGYSSEEVLKDIEAALDKEAALELLFTCDGRACGHGAQWANRVFGQRILYGRDDLQRYRVFAFGESRLLLYASARTLDRQYLHVETLRADGATENGN
ncbi:MAG: DUF4892 domain-containing protein [Pseudomonadota bacterium]